MRVGVLGLGLIGGSLARAYAKACHEVYAAETDSSILSFAKLAGVVKDKLTQDVLPSCDLVLLAIYTSASVCWVKENAQYISKSAFVIDCCGVKEEICSQCFPLAEQYGFTYIGGHPMAGSHYSGFKYSRSNLFQGAPMVLVPPRFDDPELLQTTQALLAPCGFGFYSVTTAKEHDAMIAFTSQMPHIISNAFIQSPTAQEHKGFSAGSYKDLTRVAWLNAGMWAELMMENKENTLYELDILIAKLYQYRAAIAQDDTAALVTLLEAGKKRKEEVDG